MKFARKFTTPGDTYPGIKFVPRTVTRRTPGGGAHPVTVVVPEDWDQTAVEIMGQKYMRRAGVPEFTRPVAEAGVPDLFRRREPEEAGAVATAESDARAVFLRLAGCWTYWGWKLGYFDTFEDAHAYRDEMMYVLATRKWSPNSPQWFNTGLYWAYGITAPDSGQWAVSHERIGIEPGAAATTDPCGVCVTRAPVSYIRPAANACFILGVNDSLLGKGGIYDTAEREARIFKFGGGAGANFSALRGEGEKLSGGGYSSGLMSFLSLLDAGAGGIKSGGVTRRAAKMIALDLNHPDIFRFVRWKAEEEYRVAAMLAGDKLIRAARAGYGGPIDGPYIPAGVARQHRRARELGFEPSWPRSAYSDHFDGHDSAYQHVDGQNANNSVRVTNAFMARVAADGPWELINRTDGAVARTVRARELWEEVTRAAWGCADPGVQFHDTINDWNTCPEDGEIRASNPCSEYLWLDDTACNLGSAKLTAFAVAGPRGEVTDFDVDAFGHVCRFAAVTLDITVGMAGYPSEEVAEGSRKYRTIGLGYCDLGALLMRMGYAYDSDAARAWAAALTSLMHSFALQASADMADALGAFPRYEANRGHCLRVVANHAAWADRVAGDRTAAYSELRVVPPDVDGVGCLPEGIRAAVREEAEGAHLKAIASGLRNAQVTLLAPTGTIGLQLGCDTTGIEPDFALVKDKKLVGGGYFKILNSGVPAALAALGYPEGQARDVVEYVFGTRDVANGTDPDGAAVDIKTALLGCGLTPGELVSLHEHAQRSDSLEAAARVAVDRWRWDELLGAGLVEWLDARPGREGGWRPLTSLLVKSGARFAAAAERVDEWDRVVCGAGTVEGAPHLNPADYGVFDCATPSGVGVRSIRYEAHVLMMAAAQPALSGGISKTINMPPDAAPDDVDRAYRLSHVSMVKCAALYLDGSKLSQPLSASGTGAGAADYDTVFFGGAADALPGEAAVTCDAAPEPDPDPDPLAVPPAYADHPAPEGARRERLPDRRGGYTQLFKVGGQSFYMRTGEYPDGRIGEIFIDCADQGSAFRALGNTLAIAVSLGLQHGVPLEEYADAFVGMRFEPAGVVQSHPRIKMAGSIIDAMFKDLAITYLGRDELAHVQGPPDALRPPSQGLTFRGAQTVEPPPVAPAPPTAAFGAAAVTFGAAPADAPRLRIGGGLCPACGNFSLRRTGPCDLCSVCFYSGGC